ncbi:hypothetical protein [Sphingomonas sp. 1P08PE]|uniref:hypothetical protein n=1 Tax=Sphingomonas sp. 1P08PE TaxID=554122 RepID=UPI0039A375A7
MDVSVTPIAERIARVLAAERISANGEGEQESASAAVDGAWKDHLPEALAVLRTLREPDQAMAAAGDVAVWERMVRAAIEASLPPKVVM